MVHISSLYDKETFPQIYHSIVVLYASMSVSAAFLLHTKAVALVASRAN